MSEARQQPRPPASILQLRHGEPDVSASAATYAEAVAQQGLPETHTQLLRDLKDWVATDPETGHSPREALLRVLEVEADILMDAAVAGTTAEHMPFLYTVVGEIFAEHGRAFEQALRREAQQAEQAYEDAIHQHMQDTGCDRLEAVYAMENVTLQRLQERQERLGLVVESLLGEETEPPPQGQTPQSTI